MRMRILFLSSLLTTFLYTPTISQLIDKSCSDRSNYTSNSAFVTNLNLLLSSFSSNSSSGFFNSSSGQDPEAVYGLLLCRGDATPDTCRNCISLARQGIIQQCPNKKDAIVWYQSCFLRYSQTRFFSVLDNSTKVFKSNALNVSEPNRFHQVLRGMLGNISYEAAYNSSMVPRLFATGEAVFTSTQMIYGLVQCTRDLSASDCYKCLTTAISEIPMCCSGKQGGQLLGASCNLRYEIYPFFDEEQVAALGPAPPFPSPASSTTSDSLAPVADNTNASSTIGNQGSERISSQVIVAIVVPVVIGVALFMFIINICLVRRKNKGKTTVRHHIGNVESLHFDLATIRTATANFLDANKLGQGGFGSVYKGKLSDGQEIAVKRLFRSSKQGLEEFKNEVELVAKLQHRNLVRLLGCCLEGEEQILIFEYVPNKSLDKFLFDSTKRACLDWERRYKIIEGIARGLLYLHEDSRLKIIHRDLKASNVLLDGEMNPKISDFGTARLFDVGQTQGDTSRITGTYGYMSPEYAMQGKFSIKSDVFSFGVLLLEIMTGLKNYGFHQSDLAEDLPSYAWRHWNDGTASELIDATLIEGCCMEEVMRCIHIGLLCVQEKVADRPTMSSVVLMLNKDSITLPSPLPPVFSEGNRSESDIPSTIECDSCTAEFDLSDCKLLSWPVTEVLDIELGTR